MEKILPSSTLNYKPTPAQVRAIARMETALGLNSEDRPPSNRREARNLIYSLREQLKKKE